MDAQLGAKQPAAFHRQVHASAVLYTLDYANVPAFLDEGSRIELRGVDVTPIAREPLASQRHEKFAQSIAKGLSGREAYAGIYKTKGKTADESASRRAKNPDVKVRIVELQCPAAADIVLTILEKRMYLERVVRIAVGSVTQSSNLCQSYKLTTTEDGASTEYKMPCNLKAIELDARLAGEFIEKVEATVKHTHLTLEELEQRIKDGDA